MKRKVLSWILCLCMLAMLMPVLFMSAQAYTTCSQEKAVEYANSLKGHQWDVDNESYDCVDIIKLYFKNIGGMEDAYTQKGNATVYASTAAIPSGWERKYYSNGYVPEPGDVAVWSAGYHAYTGNNRWGHVAIVVSVSGSTIYFVDQDSNLQRAAEENYCAASDPTCFIHPDYTPPVPTGINLPNGVYYIKSALNENYAVTTNGSNIEVAPFDPNDEKQQFVIEAVSEETYYQIVNKASGQTFDISGGSPAAGANLQQIALSAGGANDAQRWRFLDVGNGHFNIQSKLNTYIEVYDSKTVAGQNVWMNAVNDIAAQKFKLCLKSPDTVKFSTESCMTTGAVTVSWDHAYGAGSYHYYLTEFPEAFAYETNVTSGTTTSNSVLFSGLPTGTYHFFLEAANPYSRGSQSNWVSFNVYNQDYIPAARKTYNGHIYALYDYETSWTFARDLCRDMGGHLVTVNDAGESAFINNLITSGAKDAYWLGATNYNGAAANQNGAWSWVTGEAFSFTNWYAGEPSASGEGGTREHWAEVRKSFSGKWNDVNNISRAGKGFILEIEPAEADITARAKHNGNEYLLIDKNSTWSEAEEYCRLLGGRLLEVDDADEAAFVDSFMESGTRSWYYVGAVRYDGAWHRVTDGSVIADSEIDWSGSLWPEYCNYLMKYKVSKKHLNFPNTYYPERDISKIGFICEIESNTCTLTYDPNDGTGAPGAQTAEAGETITLRTTIPTREGYAFLGWAAAATAAEAQYQPGDSYTVSGNATLYAVWKPYEYLVGTLAIRDTGGTELTFIPTGPFLVTVPITKQTEGGDAMVLLASYTSTGQYRGLLYVSVEDVPAGGTVKITLPVDNVNGDIAALKAFAISSFGDPTPLGPASAFPAQ